MGWTYSQRGMPSTMNYKEENRKEKGKSEIRVGTLNDIKEGKSYQQIVEEAQNRLKWRKYS